MSMNGVSAMSTQKILTDLRNVTFSQALEAGHTHYDWLDGQKVDKCGRDLALASHSVSPEKVKELTTTDTFGPLFDGSSPSTDLQLFLGSRLRVNLEGRGSPEYVLTWKQWDMLLGQPICALRASGHRTSGKDCGGWATPICEDARHNGNTPNTGYADKLVFQAHLAGWMTPTQTNITRTEEGIEKRKEYRKSIGRKFVEGNLEEQATNQMAGWPTASVRDHKGGYEGGRIRNGKTSTDTLDVTAQLTTTPVKMEKPGAYRLNPFFSLWIMGFPVEWGYSGARAMQ